MVTNVTLIYPNKVGILFNAILLEKFYVQEWMQGDLGTPAGVGVASTVAISRVTRITSEGAGRENGCFLNSHDDVIQRKRR